jgi:NAD(P)-dependent dehydrogenase (short-subunit alcohol dehydrogenase family)
MYLCLRDRVVLVTGGSSGVGLATVRQLLAEGASVATCARDLTRLKTATRALDGGERLFVAACDVTDPEQSEGFVAQAGARFGRLDGLVLNAGRSRMAPFAATSFADWQEELELKFGGLLHTLHAALPMLRAADQAAIVAVNAVLARQPEPRLIATSAARAGVLNLTRSLATELAADGIRVNSVLLGLIDTGQWRRRYEEAGTAQDFADWSQDLARSRGIALGRLGNAEEVAGMITVLLSPVASYVTGASVEIDGGVARYA